MCIHIDTETLTRASRNALAADVEAVADFVEGDSDNPLRVVAANRLHEQAAALRARAVVEKLINHRG